MQTRGSRQDLPPPESNALEVFIPTSPVSVASFVSAVAAAFAPGSYDHTSGSPSLRNATGSAAAQMVEPSQHSAAADAANLDESNVGPGAKHNEPPNYKSKSLKDNALALFGSLTLILRFQSASYQRKMPNSSLLRKAV